MKYWQWNFFGANKNQVSCIINDGTPLKFVSSGNLTSADRLTFCRPIRNKCRLLRPPFGRSFKNLKIKGELIAGGFSDCLLPSTPPLSFSASTSVKLSRPATLTLQITPKNRQLSRLSFTHYCTFQNTQIRKFKSQLTFAFTEKLFSVKHTPQNCFTHLQNLHVCSLNDVLSDPRSISCNKIFFLIQIILYWNKLILIQQISYLPT